MPRVISDHEWNAFSLYRMRKDHRRFRFFALREFNRIEDLYEIVSVDLLAIPSERFSLGENRLKTADLCHRAADLHFVVVNHSD